MGIRSEPVKSVSKTAHCMTFTSLKDVRTVEEASLEVLWGERVMSRVIHTYCDCCGREITGELHEPELFVSMTIHKNPEIHFCFDCARLLLDAWWKEVRRIRDEGLVEVKGRKKK